MSDDTGNGKGGGYFPTFKSAPGLVRNVYFPTFGRAVGRVARWRVWRKIAFVVLAVIVVVGVIDVAATIYEGGKVKAKLAALKAQGVPVSWKELIPIPVPDAENGAKLYMQAADTIKARDKVATAGPEAKWEAWVRNHGGPPIGPRDWAERRPVGRYDGAMDWAYPRRMAVVARYVAEDADALALVKEAAARPQAWFNLDWSNPPQTTFKHLAQMRNLARFVTSATVVASRQGRQGDALDDLRAGFAMGRQVCPEPTLIDQLVCYALDGYMMDAAERVIGRGPLPEDEARALNEELGRIDYMASMNRAMEMERGFGLFMFDQVRRDPKTVAQLVSPQGPGPEEQGPSKWLLWGYVYLLRPAVYADEMDYLKEMDWSAAMVSLPAREAKAREGNTPHVAGTRWYSLVTQVLLPTFSKVSMRRDQTMAERALVGAAMGVELYKQKAGRYPAGLDEVKRMGWKVADDPFSGKELVYKVVGPTYLLYSIGPDLKDDGGKPGLWQMVEWGLQAPPQIRGGPPGTGRGGSVDNLAGVAGRDAGDLVWMGTWEAVEKARR